MTQGERLHYAARMGAHKLSARYLLGAQAGAAEGITMRQAIAALVLATIAYHGDNRTRAAKALGIDRRKLYRILEWSWDAVGIRRNKEHSLLDYWKDATSEPT